MTKKMLKPFIYVMAIILGLLGGSFGLIVFTMPYTEHLHVGDEIYYSLNGEDEINFVENVGVADGSMSVHFIELGNKYTGDCTYIKVGENIDILIDCGSRTSSIPYVEKYLRTYVTDNTLDYVVVTHAHRDHYAGFATSTKMESIFDLFYCKNIITFSQTSPGKTSTSTYKNFDRELHAAVADENQTPSTIYTAKQCIDLAKQENPNATSYKFDLIDGINLEILDSKFYHEACDNENENSVCCMINQGNKNYLFTGDLEEEGEAELVALHNGTLPKVELLKAGHHGSKTSSSTLFLETILDENNPAIVAVCCCAGSSEYSGNVENQFPTKQFIDRISVYTTLVYVTTMCINYKNNEFVSFNGNIVVSSTASEAIVVNCSNNNTLLKDSEWFKQNRYEMCKNSMDSSWL
ncbi:MAG: MBL fold metallo-hydrolase [Clostridia bacterium]|nr:MBL fold metallo-hydrolase [Clostridia bacterium]